MKKAHSDTVAETGDHYEDWIKWVDGGISIGFTVLAIITASQFWALVKGAAFDLALTAQSRFAGLANQVAILVYAYSWISGSLKDVSLQKKSYVVITDEARVKQIGNIIAPTLGLLGIGLLCSLKYGTALVFWINLLAFIFADLFGWCWLMRRGLEATYNNSISERLQRRESTYVKDVLKLLVVRDYVAGDWKKSRYVAMFAIALLGIACSVRPEFYQTIYRSLGIPDYLGQAAPVWLYLLVAEGWMWIFRLRAWFCVDKLDQVFKLEKNLLMFEGFGKLGLLRKNGQ
jgi:hypothetical protein